MHDHRDSRSKKNHDVQKVFPFVYYFPNLVTIIVPLVGTFLRPIKLIQEISGPSPRIPSGKVRHFRHHY